MALFGPRLDRPSAIGDEGRPRATSLTIASLAVFATVATASYLADALSLTVGIVTLSALVAIGLALLNRERFLALFLGQLCYMLGGTSLIGFLVLMLVREPQYGLLFTGFALALTGMATTWADVANRENTKTALFQGGVSYVSMILWFVVLLSIAGVLYVFWLLLTSRAATVPPTPSLLAFLFAVSVSALFVWLGARWLPFRQLTPQDRRPRLDHRVSRLRLAIALLSAVAFGAFVLGAVVWALGGFDVLYAAVPPVSALFGGLSSPFVLGPVLFVGFVVLVAALAALVLRRITRPTDTRANQLLAGVLAGFAFNLLFLPFLLPYVPVPGTWGVVIAFLLVVFGPLALFAVGLSFLVAVVIGLLPDRAGGPAVAAAGMVLATVGAGMTGVHAAVVFACVTAGMVAWDVSAFGLGVTADLGHLPETRRLELFHGVLGVVVGVVVVAALTGVDALRTTVAGGLVAGPAILLAVVAVLVLLIPVRG